jgi:hypothetical protein
LTLQTPTLQLNGGAQLQSSIGGLTLVRGERPIVGEFAMGGSLTDDPQSPSPRVTLGNFRGHLLINAGSGNDIIIGELSLVPPIQRVGMRPPPPRVQVFTRVERPPTFVPPPPPLTPPVDQPIVEPEADVVVARYLEVRIVVPIDDAGNVREQMVMKLPAEWLERLPMILRRLPDDRYRIYLMLNGGEEERLVIDVFVRDGRPVEPTDTQADAAAIEGNVPLPDLRNPGADATTPADGQPALSPAARALDQVPMSPMPSRDATGHWQPTTESAPGGRGNGRLFVGAGVTVAALIAGRKTDQWRQSVAVAAEAIGRQPRQKNWRLWRTHQPNGIPRS